MSTTNDERLAIHTLAKEIAAELDVLVEQERAAKGAALIQALLKNPQLLELLAPDHGRTTCKEEDPQQNEGRCVRCTLLQARKAEYWDSDYDFEFTVQERRRP